MHWSDNDKNDVALVAAEGPVPGPHEYVMLVGRNVRNAEKSHTSTLV